MEASEVNEVSPVKSETHSVLHAKLNRKRRRAMYAYNKSENKFTNALAALFAEERLDMSGDTAQARRLRNRAKRLRKQVIVYMDVVA